LSGEPYGETLGSAPPGAPVPEDGVGDCGGQATAGGEGLGIACLSGTCGTCGSGGGGGGGGGGDGGGRAVAGKVRGDG